MAEADKQRVEALIAADPALASASAAGKKKPRVKSNDGGSEAGAGKPAIKRAKTSYVLFTEDKRQEVMASNPGILN